VGDNRKIDVLSFHGKKQIRLWIVAIIDAYSGTWVGIHISPFEPGSTEIALALRDAILRWGLPEAFYCDWGKDYASAHLQSALAELGTRILHAQPFSPWAKGTVEGNAFGTMSKCFDPTMPGYVGRNATERAHGVKAVLQFDELSSRIKHWALTEFNQLVFQKRRLKGQRACRLDFARAQAIPARFPAKDTLLLCLMKRARRTVSPSGISLGGLCSFWNHTSPVLWKLAEERAEVEIRYDPADMSRAYVFHRGEFLCEVMDTRAADVALSERDVRDRMERRGERIKALRDATREDRVAAMNPDTYMEYLAEQRAIEVPAAAVAGGGGVRPIRQMIPHLDRAASQIRRPGRPSGPRPLVPCQDAGDRLPDLADKPLPPGWE
jgi:hypothetical protein